MLSDFKILYPIDIEKQSEINLGFDLIRSYSEFIVYKESVQKGKMNSCLPKENSLQFILNSLFLFEQEKEYTQDIITIINKRDNIQTFISILQSKVIDDYYSSNSNIVESCKEKYKEKIVPFILTDENLIEIKSFLENTIIILPLNRGAKGITTSFLRTAINSKWIQIIDGNSEVEINTLLTAYVLLVILHESNHFIKRYFNENKYEVEVETPGGIYKKDGGELLFDNLFNVPCINLLYIHQDQALLNPDNWNSLDSLKKIVESTDQIGCFIKYMTNKPIEKQSFCVIRHRGQNVNCPD